MFERIPYQIFFENLTLEEKSILLLTRQFLNRSGIGSTHLNIKEIAKQLGLSYKQLYNPWRKLMHKGYIEKCTGKTISKYKFTDKIDWNWYAALKALKVEQATPSKLLVG
ncbi:hypothetical protein [Pedobacter flavus]|uniref:Winged helix-turn-helix domain-containing protein n=1 Tax=Pedobacter flavus TaxID=3113906 RepID=A0ABU7GZJ6_9SPHI|nr:hypothetical protein [Pedobacter sp. VNH31]MEE1884365.1 hypothetical protein [Pedobacter sp. VNH31]